MEPEEHIILDDEPAHQDQPHTHPVENRREYIKFAAVLFTIFLVSVGVTTLRGWGGNRFANDFMAVFFVTFAAFKFVNIEMFAITYRTYDILAKRYRPWPYMFPFIEAFLGFGYFISTDAWQLNVITILFTGTAGYSVWKELRKKSNFSCACLGSFIRLPLSKVSFVEDSAMFVMATIMLIG